MRPKSLEDVVAAGLCTGCGLCAARRDEIEMHVTEHGHLRPRAARPPPAARLQTLLSACPGVVVEGAGDSAETHPIWGPVLSSRRAYATDPEIRFRGSSGGVISALAAFLLERGEIDFVLQIGAAAETPLRNVAHMSSSVAEVVARAGSRYAPAATLAGLDELLAQECRFAVIGKPCEIAGLRNLARVDPRVNRRIPYMLSFFCAGVPGFHGTRAALDRMGVQAAAVTGLRYRGNGWPGRMTAETGSGEASLSYRESWGEVLHRHLQFRCKICPDGTGELADIVAADAWSTPDGYPDFEERDGISAVLARTPRGRDLLDACINAGALKASPLMLAELEAMQPYQARRKRVVLARLAALAATGRPLPRYRGMRLLRNALRAGPVSLLRNFAAAAVRSLGRASRV